MHRFPGEFFARDTLVVARELLGARLVRRWNDHCLRGIIVECEAYIGWDDSACHASRGRTPRNGVMFGPPGHAYVYFTYGIHWMLNVVTEEEGFPAAVLIRALQPIQGMEVMGMLRGAKARHLKDRELTSGPAKLTKAMAIDGDFNGTDLIVGDTLWLEKGNPVSEDAVQCGPRVGISFAEQKDRQAPWRFWIRDNRYISR